jgi:hypothetical protein
MRAKAVGYASVEGPAWYNKKLAKRRINVVLKFLEDQYFNLGEVIRGPSKAVGEKPVKEKNVRPSDIKEEDRRVDLEFMVAPFNIFICCDKNGEIIGYLDGMEIFNSSSRVDLDNCPFDILLLINNLLQDLSKKAFKERISEYSRFTKKGKDRYSDSYKKIQDAVDKAINRKSKV